MHTEKWAQSPLDQYIQPLLNASSCTQFFCVHNIHKQTQIILDIPS